ncbi:hypothetical protein AJ79_01177 [Helicocarpus griseus UAMH5409]|uniref:Glutamate-1-semialdehyde 2,1-aminomutase n=1 Tax=Helicocarpus griseus UAMH5409 TaxID=1447875 RepID=A0A2B7XZR3_9EURO|nr:hypothetical protein AJ79_01177 [Helicocarpus griseus UAMH5409]
MPTPLTPHLSAAHTRYTTRNPLSHTAHQTALKHLPGGNTRSSVFTTPFPLTISSATNGTLTSLDGDTYTDFLGEYSAGIFGHSNARIARAVSDALANGWNYGGISAHESAFAERVCERFQEAGVEMVRFTNSGTEANMMAIATGIAFVNRYYLMAPAGGSSSNTTTITRVEKSKILVFSNAYHGATLTFPLSLVAEGGGGGGGGLVNGGISGPAATNLPHDFVIAPYNNVAETKEIIDALPRTTPSSGSSLAAILFEPMQGAGGCRPATREFAHFLRQVSDEHSAVLIADEVMTSRLGPAGLCVDYLGIKPDIMTLGKWVGGGMSFGAFGGRREIMELYLPGKQGGRLGHAGTFNNNVLTMVAGREGLGVYTREMVRFVNGLGERLRRGVWGVLADRGVIKRGSDGGGGGGGGEGIVDVDTFDRERRERDAKKLPRMFVTGYGSLVTVRFAGEEAEGWQALFYHYMLEKGFYIAARGYMALTMEAAEGDVDRFIECVDGFVEQYRELLI